MSEQVERWHGMPVVRTRLVGRGQVFVMNRVMYAHAGPAWSAIPTNEEARLAEWLAGWVEWPLLWEGCD